MESHDSAHMKAEEFLGILDDRTTHAQNVHLLGCAVCREELENFRELIERFRRAEPSGLGGCSPLEEWALLATGVLERAREGAMCTRRGL